MRPRRLKTDSRKPPAPKRSIVPALACGIALIAITFIAHAPAINAGYVWDDDCLVFDNPDITNADGIYHIWFNNQTPDYWPLTATSFWLEWRIWGKPAPHHMDNPTPHHVTNLTLHALAAVILWRVLQRAGVGALGAFLGGLLFAIHPVTVASAAWISERKNVLSMALCLLSILAYLRFEDEGRRTWYITALCLALLTLLAKTSVVALPVILLILAWWRRGTIARNDLLRTSPFFLLSLIFGLVTLWYQHDQVIDGVPVRPEDFASRIASVGWVFWFYIYKIVLPINLATIYPRWDIDGHRLSSFIPLALMVICYGVLWRYRRSWSKAPLAALGAFIIVLAPVMGLIGMSYSRLCLPADHLQYPGLPGMLALAGGGMAAAWTWARNRDSFSLAVSVAILNGAIIVSLSVLTWQQARVFKDEEALWTHNLKINDRCWVAYNNLGNIYGRRGDIHGAIRGYSKAIELKPEYTQPYNNRAAAYFGLGDYDKAWADVKQCQKRGGVLSPGFVQALEQVSGRSATKRAQ